ncbi:MAG TPA: LAGLIDADG family homing endonuclease, partial [Acidimicrobiales bacterium]|nr:LAGLIDADG family homing endonuclease [Acidimicrobiales bacterium]
MAVAENRLGIGIRRYFTKEGTHPYDQVNWEPRDSRISDFRTGAVAFEQLGVEVPATWSMNATNILAQKYFRGTLGTVERETSLRQVIDRVVDTITAWGTKDGYFMDAAEAATFSDELKHLIVEQKAAFNSPVWFNIGVKGVPQQASACFILAVEDNMSSILNWYVEEGTIFKGGSGSGVNLSRIRSSKELLHGGGTASGPVSFMRGADASAGTIKSGGKTRRAAKMVILDADHPDIREFIWCKAKEERKARVLAQAGFDMDLDGEDSHSTQYQNANNSVRVTDEFMKAVLEDGDWNLVARTTGETVETIKARDLFRQISEAAWECADPGLQYDTTINRWHTAPNTGRITGSNPCFTGDMLVHTDKGFVRFGDLVDRVNRGEQFSVYTHDATNVEPAEVAVLSSPEAIMITGFNDVVRLRFDNGMELRCTPSHRIFTTNRGYIPADELTPEDHVKVLDVPAPATQADLAIPVPTDPATYREPFGRSELLRFPEEWSDEFAHYLGWLVGDGSTSGNTTSTTYGSAEDRNEVLPRHSELLEWINGDRPIKISEQANGTAQLRLGRAPFKRFLESLGVESVTGAYKQVPWAIEQAPSFVASAFLRGLFDADGCVRLDHTKGCYVGLGSISPELLRGVQRLLTTFGISSRIYQARRDGQKSPFIYTRKDGTTAAHASGPSYDLRIASGSIRRFAAEIGFSLSRKSALLDEVVSHGFYDVDSTVRLAERTPEGRELTYNLSEPRNHSYVVNGVIVRNCSEYVHLDNSSCNLASLNLLRFMEEGGHFDVEGFRAAVEVVFTAQEILVGNADYPTEKIGDTTRKFRELGLGYANLGALLMSEGLPYDSDEGRAWAGAITALMTGAAYETSARTAARMGPFAGFHENTEPMLNVLKMHRAEVAKIDEELVPTDLLSAAQEAWDHAVELAEQYGVRNSQATVLAPTGTISFLMDCDTTGIEPDLGLVKTKKLVGGGTMSIVNQTVPRALRKLGYSDAEIVDIVAYIDEHKSIVGAPLLKAEHLPVFACSMGDNVIHYLGHVKMMAAAQPFVSGAISKCVTGDTLLVTEDGLMRIGSLLGDERPDSFREKIMTVASLEGAQKTDAFYFGGPREVIDVELRSGHRVSGTKNHRLLVATDGGLGWRRLDELTQGDAVATRMGTEMWSVIPSRFDDFQPSAPYGCQKGVRIPEEMTEELAFLLGAYASEGHTTRSTWTICITNSVEAVLERVAKAVQATFGLNAAIRRSGKGCLQVVFSSQTLVEFFEYLGCGSRASEKRIPDSVLRSPRHMVLAFLQGLALDAYVTTS